MNRNISVQKKNYRNCDTLKQFQRELLLPHFLFVQLHRKGNRKRNASNPTVYKLNPHLIQFINLRIHLSKSPFRNPPPSHVSLHLILLLLCHPENAFQLFTHWPIHNGGLLIFHPHVCLSARKNTTPSNVFAT